MRRMPLPLILNSSYSAKQESQESQVGCHHRMYSDLILNSINKVKKFMIIMNRFSFSDAMSKAYYLSCAKILLNTGIIVVKKCVLHK